MTRVVSKVARAGLAVVVFLLVLALGRWSPIHAEPPFDVRALPLAGLAVLLAVAAGVSGQERRPRGLRPFVAAWVVSLVALGLCVFLRPPAGPTLRIDAPLVTTWRPFAELDVAGRDLREDAPDVRRAELTWTGLLRAPRSGTYELQARGRGRLRVAVDGREVLASEGESLRAAATLGLTEGTHELRVTMRAHGPGLRLKLGWTRPGVFGSWTDDVVPPRYFGPSVSRGWVLTDVLVGLVGLCTAALVLVVPWDRPRPLPSPRRFTWGEGIASLAGYGVLLAMMSWPLITDPAHLGVTDRPDGRLNAWILAWDVHALLHDPLHVFDAPIFHPLPDALAFSENLLLPAVLSAPALFLGGPVLGYNAVLLLSLAISGLGVQLLVRRVSGDRLAAFVGGALFAAGAHRWIRLAHLHAQVTVFLPLALLAFDAFWARRSWKRALLVGLLLALQGWSSVYLGAIAATALAAGAALALLAGLRLRDAGKLLAAAALAALLLWPVVSPYLRMRAFQGVEFTMDTVAEYATTLDSYAASGTRAYGGLSARHLDPDRVRDTLFPGLVAVVLGLSGLAVAPRRYRAYFVVASALAIVISLGPATAFYRFLHEQVVLVRGVRALSRFSLLPVLGLSVLTGLALSGRRLGTSVLALVLLMLESTNAPVGYGTYEPPSAVARWLAGRPGAVAYLPLGGGDTEAMLDGVAHFRPMVNGDSGFLPRPYDRAMELLNGPMGEESLRFLRAVGVTQIVTRGPEATLPVAMSAGAETVSEVPSGPSAEVVRPGDVAPTVFAPDGVRVDAGAPREMDRVSFEMDARPWVAAPVIETSLDGVSWLGVTGSASLADATLSLMRDPRNGRGQVRFPRQTARFVRLDPALPVAHAPLTLGP